MSEILVLYHSLGEAMAIIKPLSGAAAKVLLGVIDRKTSALSIILPTDTTAGTYFNKTITVDGTGNTTFCVLRCSRRPFMLARK